MPWTKVKGRWVKSYGPNKRLTSWNRAHKYLSSKKKKKQYKSGARRYGTKRTPLYNTIQISKSVPKSLRTKMTYHGTLVIQPDIDPTSRVPAGFYINASSLNPKPARKFGHYTGQTPNTDGTFAQLWPEHIPTDMTIPRQSECLGMRQLDEFYQHIYVDSSKITYTVRILPGQQPSKSSIGNALSWYNDWYFGLTADDAEWTTNSKFGNMRASPSLKRMRMVTESAGNNKYGRQTVGYNPRTRLGIKDPADASQLKFNADTNIVNDPQPRCAEETYFFCGYFPSFDPEASGAGIIDAPPMPKFYIDYKMEYNVRYFERKDNVNRLNMPLIFKKW